MEIDKRGNPVFARNASPTTHPGQQDGMRTREYYAAHCPMTVSEAYRVWAGVDPNKYQFGTDSVNGRSSLADARERAGFMQWFAQMRFEYADAMVKENRATLED